jgi:hypothetical protein
LKGRIQTCSSYKGESGSKKDNDLVYKLEPFSQALELTFCPTDKVEGQIVVHGGEDELDIF